MDYVDGNLPRSIRLAFEAFLEKNPDIAEEFKGLEDATLSPELHGFPITFQKKEDIYKNTPVVALLNRPLQIRLWQVAAALLLLLSTVWIGIEYYLTTNAPGLQAESEQYTTGETLQVGSEKLSVATLDETAAVIKDDISESASTVVADNEPLAETTTHKAIQAESISTNKIIRTEESSRDIANAELQPIEDEVEMEPIVFIELDIEFEEWLSSRVDSDRINQSPASVSSLPARGIESSVKSRCGKNIDHNRIPKVIRYQKPEEERGGTLFARLAERVVPAPLSDWLDPANIQIDTEKIPPALLPEVIKQNSL